jgi:hypothetical protein
MAFPSETEKRVFSSLKRRILFYLLPLRPVLTPEARPVPSPVSLPVPGFGVNEKGASSPDFRAAS